MMAGVDGALEILGNIIMKDSVATNSRLVPTITFNRESLVARISDVYIHITDATAIATMIAINKSLSDCILRSVSTFS